jgi:hypothetical protein
MVAVVCGWLVSAVSEWYDLSWFGRFGPVPPDSRHRKRALVADFVNGSAAVVLAMVCREQGHPFKGEHLPERYIRLIDGRWSVLAERQLDVDPPFALDGDRAGLIFKTRERAVD